MNAIDKVILEHAASLHYTSADAQWKDDGATLCIKMRSGKSLGENSSLTVNLSKVSPKIGCGFSFRSGIAGNTTTSHEYRCVSRDDVINMVTALSTKLREFNFNARDIARNFAYNSADKVEVPFGSVEGLVNRRVVGNSMGSSVQALGRAATEAGKHISQINTAICPPHNSEWPPLSSHCDAVLAVKIGDSYNTAADKSQCPTTAQQGKNDE